MTAVMRFAWSARERGYVARHGQHTYLVTQTVAGWQLTIDGYVEAVHHDHKHLLRAAQQIAAAGVDSEA
jgi:hypothetical protein